jgi:hypothetical protein
MDTILYVRPVIVGPALDIERVIAEALSLHTVLLSEARSGISFMLKEWEGVIHGPIPQPFDPATVTEYDPGAIPVRSIDIWLVVVVALLVPATHE